MLLIDKDKYYSGKREKEVLLDPLCLPPDRKDKAQTLKTSIYSTLNTKAI